MVYAGVGQAEVYRSLLKIRRRRKGESLTDLSQDIGKLMVLAYPGPQDMTTQILARDSFLEALEDPQLTVQVQAQNPRNLDGALRIAQMEDGGFLSNGPQSSRRCIIDRHVAELDWYFLEVDKSL